MRCSAAKRSIVHRIWVPTKIRFVNSVSFFRWDYSLVAVGVSVRSLSAKARASMSLGRLKIRLSKKSEIIGDSEDPFFCFCWR